jgi:enoyl-CoA hydratase
MSDEILVGREGGLGRLTLNRPQALHALTTDMCSTCITVLSDWRQDPAVQAVLIDHSGERGFCAGGDIRMLADSGASDGRLARAFFFTEYRLNHLLFSYPKPVIAVMDGITMGGGVGISAANVSRESEGEEGGSERASKLASQRASGHASKRSIDRSSEQASE